MNISDWKNVKLRTQWIDLTTNVRLVRSKTGQLKKKQKYFNKWKE